MILYLLFSMAVILGAETAKSGAEPNAKNLLSAIEREDVEEVSKLLNVVGVNTYINSVTSLLYALEHEKEEIAKSLIENDKLIVDQRHAETKETALLTAIRFEVYSCVPLLLQKGASVRAKGLKKMNVLHYFARYGGERRKKDDTLKLLQVLKDAGAYEKDILDGRDDDRRTPLLTALRVENNFKPYLVEELIDAGCDVEAFDDNRYNALHYAGRHGREEIMSGLLSTKAKDHINDYNYKLYTPLKETLEEGGMNLRVVEYLIEAGAEYEKIGCRNNAIHTAVKYKRTHIVSYLLNRLLINPCLKNEEGETAITLAAIHADGDMMKTILEEGKGSDKCVDEIDDKGNTPLIHSLRAKKCQLGVVELLVAAGARLGIRDLRRNSILHHAAEHCGKEVVTFLLQKVIDKEKEPDWAFVNDSTDVNKVDEFGRCKMVNCRNNIGDTPLISATRYYFSTREPPETFDVVKALVEYGAEVNATNNRGEFALRYAIENKYTDCVFYLLEQKADATILDVYGNSLFHLDNFYVWTRNLAQALAKAGAPLNALNKNGETAITDTLKRHLKKSNAKSFYEQCSENLLYEHILAAGADVDKFNQFGEYPLQLAVDHCHVGLTQLFLSYGAQTEFKNAAGDTPLLATIKFKPLNEDNWKVVEALWKAEANVHAKDARNRSAIDILSDVRLHPLPSNVRGILQTGTGKNGKK